MSNESVRQRPFFSRIAAITDRIDSMRKNSSEKHINTLITLDMFYLVIIMVLFGYFFKYPFLLKLFFIIGLLFLIILFTARELWYGNKKLSKESKEPSFLPERGLYTDFDIGLPNSQEYEKNLKKVIE